MGACGRAGRGNERRHRRLRPRTSPEDDRGFCTSRPSPPPFPQRRRATSASGRGGAGWPSKCDDNHNFPLSDDHRRHARGSDDHGFAPPSSGSRAFGDDPLCQPDRERGWQTWTSAMSEDTQSWIPQLEAFDGWENLNDAAEVEERQEAENGFPRSPPATLPSCRSEVRLDPPSPQPREFCWTPGSRPRYGLQPKRAKKGAMWRGGRTRTVVSCRSAHHQLSKRPRWDARFWIRVRDAAPVVGSAVGSSSDIRYCWVDIDYCRAAFRCTAEHEVDVQRHHPLQPELRRKRPMGW